MNADRGQPRRQGPANAEAGGVTLEYPLQKEALAAWRQMLQSNRPLNAGLIFDRFVANTGDPLARAGGRARGQDAKGQAWGELVAVSSRADGNLLQALLARWRAIAQAAGARPFTLRTDWRLVAGLGRGGPLEAGFTFGRHGFPFLPASSLKGLARAYGLRQLAQQLKLSRLNLEGAGEAQSQRLGKLAKLEKALMDEGELAKAWAKAGLPQPVPPLAHDWRAIFGTTAMAGGAIFLDGLPTKPPTLALDVMNPHYPGYYQGDAFPDDSQSPRPIRFLTVDKDNEFTFAVGWRDVVEDEGGRRLRLAADWLRQGLMRLGAGGKTSAGYGYFV
jgi:CRISPR-associated protein Cmr6